MHIIETEKGYTPMGSGYLYAIEAKTFTEEMDVENMVEIGWLKDSAKFTHSTEMKKISAANSDGAIAYVPGASTTEFDTSIISYNPENVRRFLLGGKGDTTEGYDTTYFSNYRRPEVALIFVGTDASNGKEVKLVMPRCVWVGTYELNFNNDDPIETNYHFECLRYKRSNGETCTAYLKTPTVEAAE